MSARFAIRHREHTKNTKGTKTSSYDTKMSLYTVAFVSIVVLRFSMTSVAAQPPATAAELKSKLEHRVHDIAAHVDGVVGYEILDLTSGERVGHLEGDVFPTASTIKLAVVYELFKQADEGRIKLEDRITLDHTKAVGGSGVLHEMGMPTLSIRDYATLMVMLSDNTATNVLIDLVGMENVTKRMQGLGLGSTKLRRHMIDLAAARRGDENVSTPA
ncbi:MAG TPA: serine hydrolase, partial [Vicinamibacterales bacterium]|nr:serine hydrolase [Vicinamibacterales bacterium]